MTNDRETKHIKSQTIIQSLRKQIIILEEKASEEVNMEMDDADILSYKNTGYQRESPQFEPKSKEMINQFTCDQCDCAFQTKLHLKLHNDEHHGACIHQCTDCDATFKLEKELEVHTRTTHMVPEADTEEFNCNDCSFQANGRKELNNHLNAMHHNPSSLSADMNNTNYLFCHSCGRKCMSKDDLMKHRKVDHPDIIKRCKLFARGICGYDDIICW